MDIEKSGLELLADSLAKFSITNRDIDRNISQKSRYRVTRSALRGPRKRSKRPRHLHNNHGRVSKPRLEERKTAARPHNEANSNSHHDHTATREGATTESGELILVDYIDLTDESKSLEAILDESVAMYVEATWFPKGHTRRRSDI
ncbi:hypothetical protein ACJZ2D_002267 [Fusarium nematophilum]